MLETIVRSGAGLPRAWEPPEGIETAAELFTGYVLLDALIGNTDRHHENWAIIERAEPGGTRRELAPTYDHASSLGRNEPEERLRTRLATKDAGFSVQAYAERAASALYLAETDRRPLTTFDAFLRVAERRERAARVWLRQLASVPGDAFAGLCAEMPPDRMSPLVAEFVQRILEHNRVRLLALAPEEG